MAARATPTAEEKGCSAGAAGWPRRRKGAASGG